MKQQFFDLSFEQQEDGSIRLKQRSCLGECVHIDLHPQQLSHVAHALETPSTRAPLPRELVRRLDLLQHGIKALYNYLDAIPCFPPKGDETEDVIMARELLNGIDELLEVFGLAACNPMDYTSAASVPTQITSPTPSTEEQRGAQLGFDV